MREIPTNETNLILIWKIQEMKEDENWANKIVITQVCVQFFQANSISPGFFFSNPTEINSPSNVSLWLYIY